MKIEIERYLSRYYHIKNMINGRFQCTLCLILFINLSQNVQCQGVTSNWYFGDSAAIQFQNYISSPIFDSQMYSIKGTASISQQNGLLLYYANPEFVFNKSHEVVYNGINLIGNDTTIQGSLLIPHPTNPNWTFLITNEWDNTDSQLDGLYLHKIKRDFEFSQGSILESDKNIHILNIENQGFTAVHHQNGRDVWLVTRNPTSDTMISILITDSGAIMPPIYSISSIMCACTSTCECYSTGQIKSSPSGDYIAEAFNGASNELEFVGAIHKFNRTTGMVTSTVGIAPFYNSLPYFPYGVEFSASGKLLYLSFNGFYLGSTIQQYNLSVFDSLNIALSRTQIADTIYGVFSLQIGVDRKIYSATRLSFLGRIENPEAQGSNVVYDDFSLNLSPKSSKEGLPDFIQTYFHPAYFDYSRPCGNAPIDFFIRTNQIDSVRWDFGDPASGANNTSTAPEPSHQFSNIDTFGVSAMAYSGGVADTFFREIILFVPPSLSAVSAINYRCIGDTFIFNVPNADAFTSILWSDSSENMHRTFTQPDSINYLLYNFCDTVGSYVKINFDPPFSLNLGNDTVLCDVDSLKINSNSTQSVNHTWSTGSTQDEIQVSTSGTYYVRAFNGCDTLSDTIELTFLTSPALQMSDTMICSEPPVSLIPNPQIGVQYAMISESGDSVSVDSVSESGEYSIIAHNVCDTVLAMISIRLKSPPELRIEQGDLFCPGGSVRLTAVGLQGSVLWSTGDTSAMITVSETDEYAVTITDDTCTIRSSILLDYDVCDSLCYPRLANVITPNGDGLNDWFKPVIDCRVEQFDFTVYNRWGQIVFSSQALEFGWDGHMLGAQAVSGTYYFNLHYSLPDHRGEQRQYRGVLTLMD